MRPKFVGEEGQAIKIQIVFTNAFVRLSRAACAKRNVSSYVSEIVESDGQTAFDADDVDDVHDGVNARQSFAGSNSTNQRFCGAAITRGVFSERLVAGARGKNGGRCEHGASIGKPKNPFFAGPQPFLKRSRSLNCFDVCGETTERDARTLRF